jgi:Domain of unknown function (DUF6089)
MQNFRNHISKGRKPRNRRNLIFSMLFPLFSILYISPSFSQNLFSNLFKGDGSRRRSNFEKHSDISFGIGTSNYYGDVAPFNRPIQSTLQNIRWNASFNYTRHFSPHLSGSVGFTWARIAADDNKFEGVLGLDQLYMRNVHFRNDVKELAVTGIYNFIPESRSFRNREKIIPYVFAGIAIFHHNPEAKIPTDYAGSEASPGEWVSLQPLSTEGQGLNGYPDQPYNLINVSIPFGVGVRYKLNRAWDLGFEVGVRYTFSDYLDDVGGYYADPTDLLQISTLSAAMGHRENEKFAALSGKDREAFIRNYYATQGTKGSPANPAFLNATLFPLNTLPTFDGAFGEGRNSSSKLNDMYLLTSFRIIYHIAPSIKCPVIR